MCLWVKPRRLTAESSFLFVCFLLTKKNLTGILVLLLTCIHRHTTVTLPPRRSHLRNVNGDATGGKGGDAAPSAAAARGSCATTPQPTRRSPNGSTVFWIKCLCVSAGFWLTHRSLRARSVCLLGTAELHPELRFPKLHQTPRLDVEDAATV